MEKKGVRGERGENVLPAIYCRQTLAGYSGYGGNGGSVEDLPSYCIRSHTHHKPIPVGVTSRSQSCSIRRIKGVGNLSRRGTDTTKFRRKRIYFRVLSEGVYFSADFGEIRSRMR